MRPAIRVDNLSKLYQLGQSNGQGYRTLRESLTGAASNAWHGMKRAGSRLFGNARTESATQGGEFWALKDVSFEVQPGEVVGIIGRNGAGKSTLLKILSRITEPTSGRAEIRGRMGSLLEVGTGFHPELTGRENIYLNGSILGMSRREITSKFDEIVAFSEIEQFLDTPVKRYSSGMYVRLAFAVAAHLDLDILVVDEVLAVGDMLFQKKCLGKMKATATEGRTILFVSHNMTTIRTLCNRGLILKKGVVETDANVNQAVDRYFSESASPECEIKWELGQAPSGNGVALKRVFLSDCSGNKCSQIDFREPFEISVEYDLTKPMRGVRIGFLLTHSDGAVAFGSSDYGPWTCEKKPNGTYTSTCRIPGHTLNQGIYYFTVASDIPPDAPNFYVPNCIKITVLDLEGHGPTGECPPGIARPKLVWMNRND